jgi:hypothetical protein
VERTEAELDGADVELGTDEETQHGYWGEGPKPFGSEDEEDDENEDEGEICAWSWLHLVGLLCYIFLLLAVVLKLDMILLHTGIGAGTGKWGSPGQDDETSATSTGREVRHHFADETSEMEELTCASDPLLQIGCNPRSPDSPNMAHHCI